MLIQQRAIVDVAPDTAWPFFADISAVATCVPGVEDVQAEGPDTYRGVMVLRVGPLSLRMSGKVQVMERDQVTRHLVLAVSAEDKRLASAANARVTVVLDAANGGATLLRIDADTTIRGKLGQFGQAMVKHAADDVLESFSACLRAKLAGRQT